MTRTVVVVGFLVAFAAGWSVGMNRRVGDAKPASCSGRHGGWLVAELELSAEQQKQLEQIWSDVAKGGWRDRMDRRRQLSRERDEAIAALIRPEDKVRLDEILKQYAESSAAMERESRASYQSAVDQTKAMLTPEQRAKYEEILARHESERGSRDRHRGDRGAASRCAGGRMEAPR
jgi:Spy/CpxP family protein refolding chaperone